MGVLKSLRRLISRQALCVVVLVAYPALTHAAVTTGLGYLASAFLWSDESCLVFRKGGACRIHVASVPPERPGRLLWLLTPRQLRALATE